MSRHGHNSRLNFREARRAVLQSVIDLGAQANLADLIERADVIFLDEHNRPVTFSRVVIAWED